MKKFICVSPFQQPQKLIPGIYIPANSAVLAYDKPTSFPVIPIINGYTEPGEEVTLITVISEMDNAEKNYETLQSEVKKLEAEKSITIKLDKVKIPNSNELEVQLGVFTQLIGKINDGDKIYCDITYGTKVMNQILTMSINYGYRTKKDVITGCIVYGEKDHDTGYMKIYDITSLIYLDEIVRIMAQNGVGDPTSAIKMMMNWEDD